MRHCCSHTATGILTSMHLIKKQHSHLSLHPSTSKEVLQSIAKAICRSPSPIHFHKVKSHTGTIGIKYTDALARQSITTCSDVADTSIKTAGPEGNPLYNIYWLQKNMHKITQAQHSHLPQGLLWYLSIYHDALQAHTHPLHKLGIANTVANYHEHHQPLSKIGTANGAASNTCLPAS
jgi:hypothetical protein